MYDMYGFTEIPRVCSELWGFLLMLPDNVFNFWWWLDVLEWWFGLPPLIGGGLFMLIGLAIILAIVAPLYLYTKIAPYIGDHTDYSYNPDNERVPEDWEYEYMDSATRKMWEERNRAVFIEGLNAGRADYEAGRKRRKSKHHDDSYENGYEHGYDWS